MRKSSVHAPRPRYQAKCELVLKAIRRLVYNQHQWNSVRGYGFSMAVIAEEAGYARSQRFMETLYSMCDDGLIEKLEFDGNALSDKHVIFRLPSSVKQTSYIQEK